MADNIIPIRDNPKQDKIDMDAVLEFVEKIQTQLDKKHGEPQTLYDMYFWLTMYHLQACNDDERLEAIVLATTMQGSSHAMEVLFKRRIEEEETNG